MNLPERARALSRHLDPDGRILTLALDASKAGLPPATRLFLKDRVAAVLRGAARSPAVQGFLKKTQRRLTDYLDTELPASADGLFLVAGPNLWEAIPLALPLPNQVHVGTRPYVMPLLDAADRGGPAGVAVVDGRTAELFEVSLGEERPIGTLQAALPAVDPERRAWGRQGDSTDERYRNSTREAVEALVREAAARLGRRHRESPFVRVFFAGAADLKETFLSRLPSPLSDAVTFLKRGRPAAARIAQELDALRRLRAQEAVDDFQARRAVGEAALGPRETLEALRAGELHQVFLRPEDPLPGAECRGCGSAFAEAAGACAYCGQGLRAVPLAQVVLEHTLAHPRTELVFVREPAPWLADLGGLAGLRAPRSRTRRAKAAAGA